MIKHDATGPVMRFCSKTSEGNEVSYL